MYVMMYEAELDQLRTLRLRCELCGGYDYGHKLAVVEETGQRVHESCYFEQELTRRLVREPVRARIIPIREEKKAA